MDYSQDCAHCCFESPFLCSVVGATNSGKYLYISRGGGVLLLHIYIYFLFR